MMLKELEQIIREIFNPYILPDTVSNDKNLIQPSFDDLKEVAGLIHDKSPEEEFQKYFSKHPNFLFRTAPVSSDTFLGLLAKPPITFSFKADFAIFTIGQGGTGMTLIELENPNDKLFTKKLTPTNSLQTAIGQLDDWNQWIELNKSVFVRDSIELLKKAPLSPDKTHNGSFKVKSNIEIDQAWSGFGGHEYCQINNLIVIGRWANRSESERKRLIFYNSRYSKNYFQIRTYDQLIRKGFEGQPRFY